MYVLKEKKKRLHSGEGRREGGCGSEGGETPRGQTAVLALSASDMRCYRIIHSADIGLRDSELLFRSMINHHYSKRLELCCFINCAV